MRNLEDIYNSACDNHTECYQYLIHEKRACSLMGEKALSDLFSEYYQHMKIPMNGNYFNNILLMLNQLNAIAASMEEQSGSAEYWFRHAFELRSRAEKIASDVLRYSDGNCPQFAGSVAEIRVTCALLAYHLKNDTEAVRYAVSALNLPAWESVAETAKSIIEYAKRK